MTTTKHLLNFLAASCVLMLATPMVFAQNPTTVNFTSLSVTPSQPTVGIGKTTTLSSNFALSNGSVQAVSPGEWDIFFSPQMDVSICPPLPAGAPVFASQPVPRAANGSFHVVWQQDVTADGTMSATSFSATLTCTTTGASLGSISATWAGTEYDGTFTVVKNSGSVIIRGVTWASSNPAVATIDATGTVTGVSTGAATITATYGAVCEKLGGQPPVPDWSGCQGTTSGTTTLTVTAGTNDNNNSAPIQGGYAIITPVSGTPAGGILAYATFGLQIDSNDTLQAGVLPASMTTNAFTVVETNTSLSRDFGIAFANPNSATANLSLTLWRNDGTLIETKQQTLTAGSQMAIFVSQIFSDQASVLSNFQGTLNITSNNPIAMMGLRFRGSEFSTVLINSLSAPAAVPAISNSVGGSGALILPDFAENGGWSTQFVIANPGTSTLVARLDLFDPTGKPVAITLGGAKQSTFNVTIAPNGMAVLAPQNTSGQSLF